MMKGKAGSLSQELEWTMNCSYSMYTTKNNVEQCSILMHEAEIELSASYGKFKGVSLKKKKNLELFEVNSKPFEISPAWHMSNELKPFRSTY